MNHYPKVGVGAVIIESGNILLVLRKNAPEANHWSIPGGKVEFLETIENAIKREVFEETNLIIELDSIICVTNHIFEKEQVHFVAPTFKAHVKEGTIKKAIDPAILDIGWFPLNQLPEPLTITTINALENLK